MFKKTECKKSKKIKNHTADAIEFVHDISFALFDIIICLALDSLVLDKFLPNSIWGEIIRAIAFAGGYYLIVFIVKFFFEKTSKKTHSFDGTWYHVHIPDTTLIEGQQNIVTLSAGTTLVSKNLNDFTFEAQNYKYTIDKDYNIIVLDDSGARYIEKDNGYFSPIDQTRKNCEVYLEPSTRWWTETSEIVDEIGIDIVEVYRAESAENPTIAIQQCPVCKRRYTSVRTIDEAPRTRYGIHMYKMESDNNCIVCSYSDCWPSLKAGKLYLFRDKQVRDDKIKNFFRNHPINT